jgi:hypothetical protein
MAGDVGVHAGLSLQVPGGDGADAVLQFPRFVPEPVVTGPLFLGVLQDMEALRHWCRADLGVQEVVSVTGGWFVADVVRFHVRLSL